MDLDGDNTASSARKESMSSLDPHEEDQQELLGKWQKGGKGLSRTSTPKILIITTFCLAAIVIIQAAAILHMRKELSGQIPRLSPSKSP